MSVYKDFTLTACGNEIIVWKRTTQIRILTGHTDVITHLLTIGDILISVSNDHTMRIWNYKEGEEIHTIELHPDFNVTAILHPLTYLNKILLGSDNGRLQLWNINTCKLIYEFKGFENNCILLFLFIYNIDIHTLCQSPALDIVTVGLHDGNIIFLNLKTDEEIVTYKQSSAVTSISFRSDESQYPLMATGSDNGEIILWNLKKQKLHYTIDSIHQGHYDKILNLEFLNNEPVLLSLSSDNSIKMWIFDSSDGLPRLLRYREGHHLPPQMIRFYGGDMIATKESGSDATIFQILSAGSDRSFRVFHTIRENQSIEMSQGNVTKKAKLYNKEVDELKLPNITCIYIYILFFI